MVYHADTEIAFFYIKSWNTYRPTYCVYFESKIELDKFVDPNNYTRTHRVHDDVASQHRRTQCGTFGSTNPSNYLLSPQHMNVRVYTNNKLKL